MTEADKTAKKPAMPKGGRKGGTTFPRINLKQALEYADKLVGKTHTAPQPAKTILPGVFGNAGPEGGVRASALKQYGLLEGPPSAYEATKLARDIVAAPQEDRGPLVHGAFLNSKLFNEIFETFHDDTVSKAKIKQRALGLNVHPDSAEECVNIFVDSAVVAGLGTLDGDSLTLVSTGAVTATGEALEDEGEAAAQQPEAAAPPQEAGAAKADDAAIKGASVELPNGAEHKPEGPVQRGNKAGVTVNLNVDSSSDPDKLQKQLELLRKFNVI